jgi:hypothetical protein
LAFENSSQHEVVSCSLFNMVNLHTQPVSVALGVKAFSWRMLEP